MISPTRPLTTSLIACAGPPVYGTVNSLISARLCKSSVVRCVSLPTPVIAQDIAPGRAFAWAMRSEILLMPSKGLATTNMGFSAAKPIAVKSRGSRIGTLGAGPGRRRGTLARLVVGWVRPTLAAYTCWLTGTLHRCELVPQFCALHD